MALEENLLVYSYDAAGAVEQYRFVHFDPDGPMGTGNHARVLRVAAAGAYASGVAQNKASEAGRPISVGTIGQSMVEAGGAFGTGDPIAAGADGRAVRAVGGAVVLGVATQPAAAAGAIASVMLIPATPVAPAA